MTDTAEDVVLAVADLAYRAGASGFEVGYLRDDVPVEDAGWYATAFYRGARITVDEHRSASTAAIALAERMLRGATCRCGRGVTLADDTPGCRWHLAGQRWEPGCDAPAVKVDANRGDLTAMNRAMRRAAKRNRRPNPVTERCAACGRPIVAVRVPDRHITLTRTYVWRHFSWWANLTHHAIPVSYVKQP